MKNLTTAVLGLLVSTVAIADNLSDADKLICAAARANVCLETGDCYSATPWELSIPEFVLIDTKEKMISTTKASGLNRSSPFSNVIRSNGAIYLQGHEGDRNFSFVISEESGYLTAAIARDGSSVTVFGSCTNAKL